jgi:hypothetical protein
MNEKYCYHTFAANDSFLPNVLALACSLENVNTKYPLFISLCKETFSKEKLIEFY